MAILFRCDASRAIGSGHVMRCLTLAHELSRRGELCHFVSRAHEGHLFTRIASEFPLHALPTLPANGASASAGDDYAAWLGCTQLEDASETLQVLEPASRRTITWVVVDHYGLDAQWHQQIRLGLTAAGGHPRLLVIDDLANRPLQADLLLDQNRLNSTAAEAYQPLTPPACRHLIGPHYALLGEPFRLLQPLLDQRRGPLQRLLIFFGGADLPNLTERCLRGLLEPTPLPLKLDVVLGQANPHRDRISSLLGHQPLARLHDPLPSLAGLMAQADLAIGAGGVTSWERACLALPALLASLAANQRGVIENLVAAGAAMGLGDADGLTPERVREAVINLIDNPQVLQQLSRSAATISDGWGCQRVSAAMLGLKEDVVKLRPATSGDEALWLRWANDPGTRAASFSSAPICSQAHHAWFVRRLSDPQALLLLAEAGNGLPLGYVRFECGEGMAEAPEVLISVALEPAVRGQGLAAPILRAAILELRKLRKGPLLLIAEVKSDNTTSQRLFTATGFEPSTPRRPSSLCFQYLLN